MKADPTPRQRFSWLNELPKSLNGASQFLIMSADAAFQLCKALRELRLTGDQFSQSQESAHDEDTHVNGARAIQDGGRHDGPVLGEGQRKILEVPASL